MSIHSVLKLGNKVLTTPSLQVENFATSYLYNLIKDLRDTMEELGGVGIAAPQIGYNVRVFLFGFDEANNRYPNEESIPLIALVNPVIEILSDEIIDGWEGCLSIPGLRGLVPRFKKIRYSGYDPEGNPISHVAEGFHARVVQHEFDHINGILFPFRIKDLKLFGFEDELKEEIYPQ